jgi:hypothetical protein
MASRHWTSNSGKWKVARGNAGMPDLPAVGKSGNGMKKSNNDAGTGQATKTLDRRLCTGRSGEAVVIFLFGLEALLTRDSRVL